MESELKILLSRLSILLDHNFFHFTLRVEIFNILTIYIKFKQIFYITLTKIFKTMSYSSYRYDIFKCKKRLPIKSL